ncbi:periplasmic chaperone for outer membrane proteins Skp [Ulvibacter sp. MAR_2010_11]|uniref:OmpH family outer membrane protein n=1 Tax=Ulvibacter sp. MAR_2010_11 TaxID=1250229 RepID=UPI000C2C08A1|nr:OmpH family outer membrane protein [Ulvibacter sp. MAR_2010_11]PKA83288.1 periplasmic chaperone for outer membrane proteins Skp [Ulvibacter sp. MAR_2010_11]
MKKFKLFAVAVLLFVGATSFVNAQSKIAHIDTQALVEAMPEMKAAQSQLDKLKTTYDTEIKAMAKELDTKIKQYEGEAESKTDEENAKRVQEVQGMQNNIGAYRNQALQDLDKKQVDIFKPILEKARTAIQKVARAQGFQYVLDSTTGAGLLLAEGTDLLPAVKKELGL